MSEAAPLGKFDAGMPFAGQFAGLPVEPQNRVDGRVCAVERIEMDCDSHRGLLLLKGERLGHRSIGHWLMTHWISVCASCAERGPPRSADNGIGASPQWARPPTRNLYSSIAVALGTAR